MQISDSEIQQTVLYNLTPVSSDRNHPQQGHDIRANFQQQKTSEQASEPSLAARRDTFESHLIGGQREACRLEKGLPVGKNCHVGRDGWARAGKTRRAGPV